MIHKALFTSTGTSNVNGPLLMFQRDLSLRVCHLQHTASKLTSKRHSEEAVKLISADFPNFILGIYFKTCKIPANLKQKNK